LTPVASVNEDIFHMSNEEREERGIASLPGSLELAVEALEEGNIGREVLGEHVFSEYVALKKSEWDSYRTSISSWEVENYQAKF
jgi:glutamine synthetase